MFTAAAEPDTLAKREFIEIKCVSKIRKFIL